MNTPTDEQIVAHICARPLQTIEDYVRETLRLARQGLPVKDEAEALWDDAIHAFRRGLNAQEADALATEAVRTFLAARDAERDAAVGAEVDELRKALDAAHYYIDAHEIELAEAGITRHDALDIARDKRAAALSDLAALDGETI